MNTAADRPVADTVPRTWVDRAPLRARPFLRLARYDRPIGFWLLAAPGWFAIALANIDGVWRPVELAYLLLIGIGAVAMRGAGCTFNDIVDKDLDAKVERTAERPLPAGTVTMRAAWTFLIAQCLVGFLVLLSLPRPAQVVALAAIPVVAAYPFMKRITWFPQAWLGIALNWATLVGFAATAGRLETAVWPAYLGFAAWTFGYDTIYAHMDKEDDALIGVKSTARFFGEGSRRAIGVSYALATAGVLLGGILAALGAPNRAVALAAAILAAGVFGGLLALQLRRVDLDDPASALKWFKFNRDVIVTAALVLAIVPAVGRLLP
ncbi:MAG: 4-hydroxybenzoate octaprenyltransferase [Maricaulaceae bacterium]|jgi:4-hydroxybenzoate polyprenyltransferase